MSGMLSKQYSLVYKLCYCVNILYVVKLRIASTFRQLADILAMQLVVLPIPDGII